MVFFTCNGCGASLKKNQVEKHQFQCRRSQSLSCIDCGKDFLGEGYKEHVKCISEEQKYSAKGWEPKPGQNKGEKKQMEWVEMVQNLITKVGNTDDELNSVLQKISQHDNLPRKKPKFQNFMKSLMGPRVRPALVEKTWDLLSKAFEEERAAKAQNNNQNANPKATDNLTTATAEFNGNKRKKEDTEEPIKSSKKKRKEAEAESNNELTDRTNISTTSSGDEQAAQATKIKWCSIGKAILRAQDDKELALKKFQKKIVSEYISRAGDTIGDTPVEVLWAKGLKKLSKNPKFKIHKERIKLVC